MQTPDKKDTSGDRLRARSSVFACEGELVSL